MNSQNIQLPHVRIDQAAHAHLGRIIEAFTLFGRKVSMARYLSDLILCQPIPTPNGNGRQPLAADPCDEVKEKP